MARYNNLPLALMLLNALIRRGIEYPEAHSRAVAKYSVDGDDLRDAYDDQFARDPLDATEDTPCLEDGRDNCNDHGTGEGRFHGRI
jgi:hypothetical protein